MNMVYWGFGDFGDFRTINTLGKYGKAKMNPLEIVTVRQIW